MPRKKTPAKRSVGCPAKDKFVSQIRFYIPEPNSR